MTTTASGRSKGSAPARADRADALDAIRADDRGEFADGGVQAGEASEHIPVGLSGSQYLQMRVRFVEERSHLLDACHEAIFPLRGERGTARAARDQRVPWSASVSRTEPPSETAFMGADVEMERGLPTVRSAGHGFAPHDVPLTVLDDQLAAPGCRQ